MVAEILGLQLKRTTVDAMTGASRISNAKAGSTRWSGVSRRHPPRAQDSELDLTADFIPTPLLLAEKAGSELRALAKSEGLDIYEELIPKTGSSQRGLHQPSIFAHGLVAAIG